MRTGVVAIFATLICLQLVVVAAPARSAPDARMWEVVRSDEWDLTVRSVERQLDPLASDDGKLVRPQGSFAIFAIDLANRSGRPLTPKSDDFVLMSSDGDRSVNLAALPIAQALAFAKGRSPFGDVIPPGATVTTIILFDIDPDAGRLTLHFRPATHQIRIDECKCNLPSPVRTLSGG